MEAMNSTAEREILGVVGGLGPWASAEFLKTIYEVLLRELPLSYNQPLTFF